MSKNARAILIIIVLIVVVVIAVALARQSNAPTGAANGDVTEPSALPPAPTGTTPPPAADAGATTHVVVIKDDVYTPASFTVKVGDTVTWRNEGSQPQWPASAVHPTHLVYPEFDPKQAIAPGSSWSFTFDKVGTWRWHDHIHANVNGAVTVTE